ncbi:MAG: prephenate dehydrogenase/arogenate dehydrogenase family protein [Solirubrobacteraceae bacterium]|nr:prephenate dehydrogenase/arogenate dehydrogenase family protein [Solirubrobacteraceae bacterium]
MTLAILGVGLIGGSVGLAARQRLGAEVTGWDRDPAVLDRAVAVGAIDRGAPTLAEAVDGAEIVVVAAPVGALPDAVGSALGAAGPDAVVTDVGSVKHPVVQAHGGDHRFIGGHPLAGAEVAGVEHARVDLFDDATWYLTPTRASGGLLFERLHRLITSLGARPQAIDADVHDRVLASVSHLPHVLANVLVAQTAAALGGEETIPSTGPSFRDATRVAGANPPMWADIYHANRDALGMQLDAAIERLSRVRAILDDPAELQAWQSAVAEERRRLLDAGLVGTSTRELRVAVPNTPGVVADVALTLGRAGINISDMALSPSPDNRNGVIALWCAAEQADRAAELIGGLGYPVTT